MLSVVTALLASPAHALVTVTFCAKYKLNYIDSDIGEASDYFNTNTPDVVARGVTLKIVPSSGSTTFPVTEWNDGQAVGPGCVEVDLDPNKTYDISITSVNQVAGSSFWVTDTDPAPLAVSSYWVSSPSGWNDYQPVANDVSTQSTVNSHRAWNTAAAMAHALYRRDGGVTASFYAFTDDGTAPHHEGTKVFLEGGGTDSRFIIIHELAHSIAYARDEYSEAAVDCFAATNGCDGPGNQAFSEKEFQSCAAKEGWADFYAAVAFNSTAQTGCWLVNYEDLDWDLDTVTDMFQNDPLDCEYDPISSLGALDYYTEMCVPLGGTHANRATKYDWLRFWWDFMTDEAAVEFSDCMDIYDGANPSTWNDIGNAVDNCGGPTPLADACNPNSRLKTSAYLHLSDDTDWDNHLNNGNDR